MHEKFKEIIQHSHMIVKELQSVSVNLKQSSFRHLFRDFAPMLAKPIPEAKEDTNQSQLFKPKISKDFLLRMRCLQEMERPNKHLLLMNLLAKLRDLPAHKSLLDTCEDGLRESNLLKFTKKNYAVNFLNPEDYDDNVTDDISIYLSFNGNHN